jgi:hypothetical protein
MPGSESLPSHKQGRAGAPVFVPVAAVTDSGATPPDLPDGKTAKVCVSAPKVVGESAQSAEGGVAVA